MESETGFTSRRIAMSRRIETESPIEAATPEAQEPRIPQATEHPARHEPAAFGPSEANRPAPPAPRPASQTDSGFGSFG
jgi:hypothetical protein